MKVVWLFALACGLSLLSAARGREWHDNRSLWSHAATVNPAAPQTLLMEALFARSDGRLADAQRLLAQAQKALADPRRPDPAKTPIGMLIWAWTDTLRGSH